MFSRRLVYYVNRGNKKVPSASQLNEIKVIQDADTMALGIDSIQNLTIINRISHIQLGIGNEIDATLRNRGISSAESLFNEKIDHLEKKIATDEKKDRINYSGVLGKIQHNLTRIETIREELFGNGNVLERLYFSASRLLPFFNEMHPVEFNDLKRRINEARLTSVGNETIERPDISGYTPIDLVNFFASGQALPEQVEELLSVQILAARPEVRAFVEYVRGIVRIYADMVSLEVYDSNKIGDRLQHILETNPSAQASFEELQSLLNESIMPNDADISNPYVLMLMEEFLYMNSVREDLPSRSFLDFDEEKNAYFQTLLAEIRTEMPATTIEPELARKFDGIDARRAQIDGFIMTLEKDYNNVEHLYGTIAGLPLQEQSARMTPIYGQIARTEADLIKAAKEIVPMLDDVQVGLNSGPYYASLVTLSGITGLTEIGNLLGNGPSVLQIFIGTHSANLRTNLNVLEADLKNKRVTTTKISAHEMMLRLMMKKNELTGLEGRNSAEAILNARASRIIGRRERLKNVSLGRDLNKGIAKRALEKIVNGVGIVQSWVGFEPFKIEKLSADKAIVTLNYVNEKFKALTALDRFSTEEEVLKVVDEAGLTFVDLEEFLLRSEALINGIKSLNYKNLKINESDWQFADFLGVVEKVKIILENRYLKEEAKERRAGEENLSEMEIYAKRLSEMREIKDSVRKELTRQIENDKDILGLAFDKNLLKIALNQGSTAAIIAAFNPMEEMALKKKIEFKQRELNKIGNRKTPRKVLLEKELVALQEKLEDLEFDRDRAAIFFQKFDRAYEFSKQGKSYWEIKKALREDVGDEVAERLGSNIFWTHWKYSREAGSWLWKNKGKIAYWGTLPFRLVEKGAQGIYRGGKWVKDSKLGHKSIEYGGKAIRFAGKGLKWGTFPIWGAFLGMKKLVKGSAGLIKRGTIGYLEWAFPKTMKKVLSDKPLEIKNN